MRIGIVCYPTFGGSGVVATELGLGLAKRGHEVHFITYKRPVRLSHFMTNIYYHEVNALDYPLFEYTPYDTTLASKLVDVIKFEKIDLLHVHYAIPHATIAFIVKKILETQGIRIPVVTTLHGTDITLVGADPSFAPVVEFSINQSDGVTAVSRDLKDDTLRYFNISRDIRVIYNFIDFDRFRKIDKEHFKKALAPDGEKILIHTSNFRKVKRVDDVIHIFQKVIQQVPCKLLLIGDGPERQRLEEICRKIKVCEHVRFLGKQEAIEELLAVSDLFLIPSENESFGLAALEAMACHVPVISSNAGGLPELNLDGTSGFVHPVGDIEGMAASAIRLLKDETLLDQYRKQAFERAREFDIDKILPQYEDYYMEVMKG
ncbi:MAG TPA: N-acetyl-alpha-D-glucosaminyl L-malate synthase BshA [Saprospiraceae bacterium]|nr:N-acetyl-alpha-D-glucosaminyl L-malate synthase BshA [Saprospiraceae bacterium]HNT20717.1 N-acetyl-alpha-D-glucosaminyl L-malate synthase BshA [Saprospiraceae bacterium]